MRPLTWSSYHHLCETPFGQWRKLFNEPLLWATAQVSGRDRFWDYPNGRGGRLRELRLYLERSCPSSMPDVCHSWDCVKSPSKQLLRTTLLLRTIICSALGSSRRTPPPPLPVAMLWPLKALIFTHFAPNSTLFGVGGKGSLVLVISLETSQHLWPLLSENHFV